MIFEKLPNEQMIEISNRLDNQELGRFSQTCRRIHQIYSQILEKRKKIVNAKIMVGFFWTYIPISLEKNLITFFEESLEKGLLKDDSGKNVNIHYVLKGLTNLRTIADLLTLFLFNRYDIINEDHFDVSADDILNKWLPPKDLKKDNFLDLVVVLSGYVKRLDTGFSSDRKRIGALIPEITRETFDIAVARKLIENSTNRDFYAFFNWSKASGGSV